jgi:hypothetical protein
MSPVRRVVEHEVRSVEQNMYVMLRVLVAMKNPGEECKSSQ